MHMAAIQNGWLKEKEMYYGITTLLQTSWCRRNFDLFCKTSRRMALFRREK